jgi:hypothetical protein
MKYVVLKVDDINKYCSALGRDRFVASINEITRGRKAEGKGENTYFVINTDEPYAEEVKEIIEKHEEEKITFE